jgi:hypothetical protein
MEDPVPRKALLSNSRVVVLNFCHQGQDIEIAQQI